MSSDIDHKFSMWIRGEQVQEPKSTKEESVCTLRARFNIPKYKSPRTVALILEHKKNDSDNSQN